MRYMMKIEPRASNPSEFFWVLYTKDEISLRPTWNMYQQGTTTTFIEAVANATEAWIHHQDSMRNQNDIPAPVQEGFGLGQGTQNPAPLTGNRLPRVPQEAQEEFYGVSFVGGQNTGV